MLSDVYCAAVILKKICDHPLLLTKRAAEYLLEGMESMLNPEEAGVAERLAMYLADVAERTAFQEKHDNISCKLSFILSLLDNLISKGHNVLIFSQTRKMLNHIQESLSSNGLFLAAILGGETLNLSRVSFPFCYSIIIILSVACIHDCQFSYILIFVTRELRIACTMSQMERERALL